MKNLSYVCVMLIYLVVSEGYKILLVFPVNSKSHRILADGYIDSLLKAGHVVTFITPHPRDIPGPNLTQIDISDNIMKYNFGQFLTLENILDGDVSYNKYKTFSVLYNVARGTMENVDVQRLLNDPEQHFDLVIAEWLFSDFYAGFSAVFNCPYIWAVSMNPSWLVLQLVEAGRNPEYYPDMHSGNSPPFSLATRLQEFTRQMHVMAMKNFIFEGLERQLYEEKIVPILRKRARNIPELAELVFNASLLIVNSHVTLAQIMTLPPNCVTVGGYHIDSRIPPLPKDLQKIMDEATHGVIYFSMGTILSSETFPKLMIQGLLNMFKGLKQVVLWKFNNVVADLPSNVQILRWAPQQSILNHPNCALFITHGGYLSITEAVHFGVPVVAIPVFADQFANVAKLELRGIGKKVDLTYNLVDDLEPAIAEVIANKRYKERMEHLSLIYHDQKSPRQRLVDWVEYVIRTGGAPHLRSPAILMPWYQQLYLDLVLILFVVFLLLSGEAKRSHLLVSRCLSVRPSVRPRIISRTVSNFQIRFSAIDY